MYYKDWKPIEKPVMRMAVEIGSYHRDLSHISSSWLKEGLKSMSKFYSYPFRPERKQTESTKIGTLFHTLLLEPEVFHNTYRVLRKSDLPFPDNTMSKKENKEYVESIAESGLTVVQEDDFNLISDMVNSLSTSDLVKKYVASGVKEASIYWSDFETGIPLRTRPDLFVKTNSGSVIVMDVKTTESAFPNDFFMSVAKWEYPVQAAMQIDGIEAVTGLKVTTYCYLAIEKTYPYDYCIYRLTQDDIEAGRVRYREILSQIKACTISGDWPGPGRTQIDRKMLNDNDLDIVDIVLPAYYYGK